MFGFLSASIRKIISPVYMEKVILITKDRKLLKY